MLLVQNVWLNNWHHLRHLYSQRLLLLLHHEKLHLVVLDLLLLHRNEVHGIQLLLLRSQILHWRLWHLIHHGHHRHHGHHWETTGNLLLRHWGRLTHNWYWRYRIFFLLFSPVFFLSLWWSRLNLLLFRSRCFSGLFNCYLCHLSCHFLGDRLDHLWSSVGRTGLLLCRVFDFVDSDILFGITRLLLFLLFAFAWVRSLLSSLCSWCLALSSWSRLHFCRLLNNGLRVGFIDLLL